MEYLSKLFVSLILALSPSFLLAEQDRNLSVGDKTQVTFIDTTYHYLNGTFCQPAIWFDQFFEDDRVSEDVQANTVVRWYNDVSKGESGDFKYKSKLNARIYLPKVTHKLKLTFESDDEVPPPTSVSDNKGKTSNQLGFRYDMYDKQRSSFNIKITLRPGIEARYRFSYPLTTETTAHFIQKTYHNSRLTGERSQIDFDYFISPYFLLRWSNFSKWETDIRAFESGSSLTLYQYISPKQAINYSVGMSAPHKPYHYINDSYISASYRQNIFKKWLFYEIKPGIDWNKVPDTAREKEASITLRLEVLFKDI